MTNEDKILWEKYKHIIENFSLMDDDFMSFVFNNDTKLTEFVLRLILETDDLIVKSVSTQVEYKHPTKRSVKLDVEATDSNGKKYNIEIQRSDKGSGVRRARFHSSMLDRELLEKNEDFDKLADTYVIFITEHDKFKMGLPLYHIERTVREMNNSNFGDGSHIIYVNGEFRDSDNPIGKLMHDFSCKKSSDMYYSTISERIKYYKEPEGDNTMCRAIEQLITENTHQNSLKTATAFIKERNIPIETIAKCTGLDLAEVEKLAKDLK